MGLRGCGKSTLGRLLAEGLGRPLVEIDDQILATFPEASVAEVWAANGEAAWRAAETSVLCECLQGAGQVIALGGGTPLIPEARHLIEAEQRLNRATVIYLRCGVAELTHRLSKEAGDRPPLLAGDAIEEIARVAEMRQPTYRSLADIEFDVTETPPTEAAAAIVRLLGQREGPIDG